MWLQNATTLSTWHTQTSENVTGEVEKTKAANQSGHKEYDHEFLSSYHIGLMVFCFLVILSNIFAILFYLKHKTIRENLSNVLLFSLALSDLMIGLIYLPILVACERLNFATHEWLKTVFRSNYLLGNLCGFSTVFHIIALTVEKYIAVLHPFRRISLSTRWTFRKVLIFIWTAAIVFALIPLIWMFKAEKASLGFEKFRIYGVFQLAIFFGMSLLILLYCYYHIFAKIHQQKSQAPLTGRVCHREHTDRKTVLVLLCFFAVFVIGWFPWFLFTLDQNLLDVPIVVKDVLVTLRYAGAFVNPLIYAFLKNDYRQAIKTDLSRLFARSPFVLNLLHLKDFYQTSARHGSHFRGQSSCDYCESL